MRILITGATGAIGHEVLIELLQHSAFTSVTALSRRDIPSSTLPNASKFKNVIVKDFGNWSQDIMDEIWDAEGIIWYVISSIEERGEKKIILTEEQGDGNEYYRARPESRLAACISSRDVQREGRAGMYGQV
jgi:nucleoside-diphosphate-sugar epimerase